jgi:Transposase IS4
MVGMRLHCRSDMEDRLQGVVSTEEAHQLEEDLQHSSAVRSLVLEVVAPLRGSKRIVNTDNFYTSVQLLLSLKKEGLYGRGTVRENSAHFPKAHMFAKNIDRPRGSSIQGVSNTGRIVAASWKDGTTVNVISNADSSTMGEVTRLVGQASHKYPAPSCIAEYNKHMQGVDRLDQLRAMFSIADGHSMKNGTRS